MVLKICNGEGWVFVDKIAQLEYINGTVELNKSGSLKDTIYDLTFGGDHPIGEIDSIAKMFVRFEDGKEKNILATQPVYLLNNEGKTIEKIN